MKITRSQTLSRYFWITCALIFILCMVTYPKEVFDASVRGLSAWWNIVFPALLPFFIGAELLMGFGIVRFMGVLLEPVMNPLFNVPGPGAFVLAIGYTSGFPISSFITAKLRKERLCTKPEAERLMSFTNNASPLFMLVAVSVGMFNSPGLGFLIAGVHYASNLLLGLVLKYFRKDDGNPTHLTPVANSPVHLIKRAITELHKAFREDPRPLGRLLGDAISTSADKLLVIGGFVIVFSVLMSILKSLGIMSLLIGFFNLILKPLGAHPGVTGALAQGLFEITLGTKAAAESGAPFIQQVTAASAILAWSGLSVHAQVASMISDTDLSIMPFFLTRIAHSLLAAVMTYLALTSGLIPIETVQPAIMPMLRGYSPTWIDVFYASLKWGTFALLALVAFGLVLATFRSFRIYRFKFR